MWFFLKKEKPSREDFRKAVLEAPYTQQQSWFNVVTLLQPKAFHHGSAMHCLHLTDA